MMDDLISRQAAIDALKGLPTWWADAGGYYGGARPPMEALLEPEDAVSAIENLPSAQPERPRGKWIGKPIAGYTTVRCSVCNNVFRENSGRWSFCPDCGADMRGEDDAKIH